MKLLPSQLVFGLGFDLNFSLVFGLNSYLNFNLGFLACRSDIRFWKRLEFRSIGVVAGGF